MGIFSRRSVFIVFWLVLASLTVNFATRATARTDSTGEAQTTFKRLSSGACSTPWHTNYSSIGDCRTHVGFSFGMDMGLSTDGNRPYWALEISYRWLYVQYAIGAGGGLGFAPTLDFAGRVEWQVLRLGFAYWHGDSLSQLDVRRNWDLTLGSALSVRLNERCLIGVGVVWYAPNPFDVSSWTEREKTRLFEAAVVDAVNDLGGAALGDGDAAKRLAEGSNFEIPSSSDLYRQVYLGAWRQPYLTAGFRVTF